MSLIGALVILLSAICTLLLGPSPEVNFMFALGIILIICHLTYHLFEKGY